MVAVLTNYSFAQITIAMSTSWCLWCMGACVLLLSIFLTIFLISVASQIFIVFFCVFCGRLTCYPQILIAC